MMFWAKMLAGLVGLVGIVAQYFKDKQLLEAGRAQATAEFSIEEADRVRRANRARVVAGDPAERERLLDKWSRD